MKNCSKCNKSWSDEYQCCPMCGEDLVSDSGHCNVRMGSSNAISGGVHSSDNHAKSNSNNVTDSNNETHTNSHNTTNNTTNNTTIIEAKKSESEKLKENEDTYRLRCKSLCKGGVISAEGERQLRELQYSLNLPDELALPIKEGVRLSTKIKKTQLPPVGVTDIRQTKSIIEQNTASALMRQLKKLEAWIREYDDDTLKLMYYQMSSMLEQVCYTIRYEESAKDEYWEAYWAYVAYLLQGNVRQADEVLASLGRWHALYPEQNDLILQIVGRIMQNDPLEDVLEVRRMLNGYYTPELQLLVGAIDELLQKDWSKDSAGILPTHSFYCNALFKNFIVSQKECGLKRLAEKRKQEEQARQEEQRRAHEKELARQAAEKAKAEAEAEAKRLQLEILENEKKKQQELERAAKEAEARPLKSGFIRSFEINDCDLLKTCSDVGISTATYRSWRNTDLVFSDKVAYIQKVHDEKVREKQRIERRANLKKALPFVFAAVVVCLIVVGVGHFINQKREYQSKLINQKREYQSKLIDQFNSKVESFNDTLTKVDNSPQGVKQLHRASVILDDIVKLEGKITDSSFVAEKSSSLKETFILKADSVLREEQNIIEELKKKDSSPESQNVQKERMELVKLVESDIKKYKK